MSEASPGSVPLVKTVAHVAANRAASASHESFQLQLAAVILVE